ncbi:cytochrome b/b6 domain-containing protein [Arthrobacter sp. YD2]|uniref:cytochrome b/b6 domain-containing protein n=1 Tax=Arthrobacter sp. YD2 TaxID=3058046 RepID=UPI0025B5B869|nr:cytochrome b/b6 domain-containing protein [Arthrobacter sp. YD2]MDN3905555.1 cytochrome b/b6 domain-containing protein [Arthrobacter sp. YD2]
MPAATTTLRRGLPRRPGGEPWPEVDGGVVGVGRGAQTAAAEAGAADMQAEVAPAEGAPQVATEAATPQEPAESTAQAVPAAEAPEPTDQPTPPTESASSATVSLRRGLPRSPGGEPWPPGGVSVPVAAAVPASSDAAANSSASDHSANGGSAAGASAPTGSAGASPASVTEAPVTDSASASSAAAVSTPVPAVAASAPNPDGTRTETVRLRQGLPRKAGEGSWPTVAEVETEVAAVEPVAASSSSPAAGAPVAASVTTDAVAADAPEAAAAPTVTAAPAGKAASASAAAVPAEPAAPAKLAAPAGAAAEAEPAAQAKPASPVASVPLAASGKPATAATPGTPATAASPTKSASVGSSSDPGKAWLSNRWAKLGAAAAALVVLAAVAVLCSRWFLSSDAGVSFLAAYPGEYHLPEGAPVGLPAWLGWQHFMNVFLMVLIIRSGLQIRRETRPSAYWTPKRPGGSKVSLTVWFHQSLDLLWLVNGAVFIVLLFATGQWMRVIPTSWEVFPNAVSAGLQYMSLDWPTDNGWVNYNALQQLAYFATIFIAAPLAAATGFRMSGVWPKKAVKASKLFPIEAARRVHFPVMLYFVAFIAVHVILVFATGALRNLNHMYAAQGSTDPSAYASNWFGFWMFVLSLAVIAGAWAASRPFILAPVASLFGKVSSR